MKKAVFVIATLVAAISIGTATAVVSYKEKQEAQGIEQTTPPVPQPMVSDTTVSEDSSAPDSSSTDEDTGTDVATEYENANKWALAMSAVYCENYGGNVYYFGMYEFPQFDKDSLAMSVISNWSISNGEEAKKQLRALIDSGHRARFKEAYALIKDLPEDEYNKFLEQTEESDRIKWEMTKQLYDKWGENAVVAWDTFRVAQVAGWSYRLGYITEEEAYGYVEEAAEITKRCFSSWEEANENYLDGYAWWSGTDMGKEGTGYQKRLECYESLKYDKVLFDDSLFTE